MEHLLLADIDIETPFDITSSESTRDLDGDMDLYQHQNSSQILQGTRRIQVRHQPPLVLQDKKDNERS